MYNRRGQGFYRALTTKKEEEEEERSREK